jgi:hypothetical protein
VTDLKRMLTTGAVTAVLALAGVGTAWACDGAGGSGDYPGSYPGTTTTDTSGSTDTSSSGDDSTTTSSAAKRAAAKKARAAKRAKARRAHRRS